MRAFARRIAPALLLAILSPIVAEFLLGDFTIRNLDVLVPLVMLYGCGALLIREIARRSGRGWLAILLLGAAYSLIEEAFLTQSLFNPNYVGQRLLDYGYVPALGTSLNWSLFVLSIHVVWSIATPILIAEGVAGDRRTQPWLKVPGLTITGVLFVLGAAGTAAFSRKASPFVATRAQFLVAGVLVLLAIAAAFMAGSREDRGERHAARPAAPAPRPLAVFVVTLVLAVVFMGTESFARAHGMPASVVVLVRVSCQAAAAFLIVSWSRRPGWRHGHYLALAAGTTVTYALFGLMAFLQGHTNLGEATGPVDIAGQVVLASAVLALIWLGRGDDGARRHNVP